MINMPYDDIIDRIKEESSITEEELNSRIKKKMDQLSGLISKEGAAYIVANDLGVKLVQASGMVKINKIVGEMRNVETAGKVMRVFDLVEFEKDGKKGKVRNFVIADETGQMRITAWHDQTELVNTFKEGDTIKITDGFVRTNQGQYEIHLNNRSKVQVNPSDIKIEGVAAPQPRPVAETTRKKIKELTEGEQNAEIFATIVQVYDPRYFEQCPQCRKRPIQREDGYMCEEHGTVTPDFGYVVNAVLDDGSDSIRAVMFRQQMQQLFGKTDDELQALRENMEKYEDLKTELLGEQVIITGRVVKNSMFDRLEIIANKVDRKVDPENEIKRLKNEEIQTEKDLPSIDEL